jgi:hypothetical protein
MKFTATEADNQIVSDYFNMLLRSAVEVDRPLNAKRCGYNHGCTLVAGLRENSTAHRAIGSPACTIRISPTQLTNTPNTNR